MFYSHCIYFKVFCLEFTAVPLVEDWKPQECYRIHRICLTHRILKIQVQIRKTPWSHNQMTLKVRHLSRSCHDQIRGLLINLLPHRRRVPEEGRVSMLWGLPSDEQCHWTRKAFSHEFIHSWIQLWGINEILFLGRAENWNLLTFNYTGDIYQHIDGIVYFAVFEIN